jgi:hypothetical protein
MDTQYDTILAFIMIIIIGFFGVMFVGGIYGMLTTPSPQPEDPFMKIVTPLIPLAYNSNIQNIDPNYRIPGNFVVWDIEQNTTVEFIDNNYASPNDTKMTVFFVTDEYIKDCGSYQRSTGGIIGRSDINVRSTGGTIVVVEYPSQKIIGKKEIEPICSSQVSAKDIEILVLIPLSTSLSQWIYSIE